MVCRSPPKNKVTGHPLDGPSRSRVARLADGTWQVIFRGVPVHHPFDAEDTAWRFLWSCRRESLAISTPVRLTFSNNGTALL